MWVGRLGLQLPSGVRGSYGCHAVSELQQKCMGGESLDMVSAGVMSPGILWKTV